LTCVKACACRRRTIDASNDKETRMALPVSDRAWIYSDPMAIWHEDHVNFGKLLGILERELATFRDGGFTDYELMRDVLRYLRYYPDRYHHPREDVAFELIAARAPHMEGVVNRLLQEHRVIAAAGDQLYERLQAASDDVVLSRESIEAPAAQYLLYYRHHLRTEEAEILPRAALLLGEKEWRQIGAAGPHGEDPLFGPLADMQYRELRRRIDEAALP
jgi:hemerythrin-like domain-containing protein